MKTNVAPALLGMAAAFLLAVGVARPASATVLSGKIAFVANNNGLPDSNYQGTITQSLLPDTTSTFFKFNGTTLQVVGGELDEGSNWYLAQPAQPFTGTQFPAIFTVTAGGSPVALPTGDVYLAITTSSHLDPGYAAYGWLHLQNNGTTLVALDSAVAYREQGLIIGTTTAVPEPATLVLMVGAIPLLLVMRPRRLARHR